jgi:thiamine phosphate synthase YjbQ (UPF0047 family)
MRPIAIAAFDERGVKAVFAKNGFVPGQRHAHHSQRVHQRRRARPAPDYDDWLEELAPHEPVDQYRHNSTWEDSAEAHLLVSTLNLIQCTLNRDKHDHERV